MEDPSMATGRPLMEPAPTAAHPALRATASPAPVPGHALTCLLPALATGTLLWICFHPLSWGWLGWVALVPLLCLVRSAGRPRLIYFSAWAAGSLFFWPVLQWMRVADPDFHRMYYTWAMLAFYCSLYFPAAVWLTRALDQRTGLPLVVTFPAVWVALEYLRSFLMTGFAWYLLGHTQHEFLAIIQVTDLGGAFAVSLLVAVVNALVFDLLYQFPGVRAFLHLKPPAAETRTFGDDWPEMGDFLLSSWRRGILIETFLAVVLVGAAYLYGTWRLDQDTLRPGPGVAMLQGNLDQRIRNHAADNQAEAAQRRKTAQHEITEHYADLCKRVLETTPEVELFIWPETSYPLAWFEVSRDLPAKNTPQFELFRDLEANTRQALREWAKQTGKAQLLGMNAGVLDPTGKVRNYNTALLLSDEGSVEARYDKMHRVPFGEYVPLRDWLPFMDRFAPYDYDYSIRQGESFTRFTVDQFRFGVLICFEDTDPFLARRYALPEDDGPAVDFLVNISNDGWFDGTSEHEAHLAVSRFRAIECRRTLVRAVNMGISAMIDSNGRVLRPDQPLPDNGRPRLWALPYAGRHGESLPQSDWAAYKQIAGVLVARVPIDDRFSPYALLGDWLAGLCWVVIGVGLVGVGVYRRLRPARA
jgi:apolipoprotein N-acyltransferase